MNKVNSKNKIRTVKIGGRGQLVIPEDIRKDMNISGNATLVLIEKGQELVIKKESAVLQQLEGEDHFWTMLAHGSLQRAWEKEDEVWDRFSKEGTK